MAKVQLTIPVEQGGRCIVSLNMNTEGSAYADRCDFRIIRTATGEATVALIGSMKVACRPTADCRSWTWVDDNIPFTKDATYTLQINRRNGTPIIGSCTLTAQHLKR